MANIFIAKSMIFYPDYYNEACQTLSDQIIIPSYALNRFMDRFDEGETSLLMKLVNTTNNKEIIVTIGIPHYYEKDTIYVPQWILDMIGCTGNCDTPIRLSKLDTVLPKATSIIIKPLDPMAFKVDLVECFQKVLETLHTLQEGTTIPVIIPELGNYEYLAYIEKVEPEGISRTHADDLAVEFLRDFEEHDEETVVTPESIVIPDAEARMEETPIIEEPVLSNEERRRRVRESWANRVTSNCATVRNENI
jgi:hypothetical protein